MEQNRRIVQPYQPKQQPPIPKPQHGYRSPSSNPYDASGRSSVDSPKRNNSRG